jgi:predicted nicotinamide N-methyase
MPPPSQIIDAPLSLGNFFPAESDEEEEELDNCYEVQQVTVAGESLQVRQYAYHSHNANRVWPGTFNLADYLFETRDDGSYVHQWGSVLELGTATGLLAIRLAKSLPSQEGEPSCCSRLVTSDVADEHGDVLDNVKHNFELNNILQPPHVPFTWGPGWKESAAKVGVETEFDTILASDILLYVSAYPALVITLQELMPSSQKLVMSWNRRMKESQEFFDRMEAGGFSCEHLGKCVYCFVRNEHQQS